MKTMQLTQQFVSIQLLRMISIRMWNGHSVSFFHIQVGFSGELPKPTMFMSLVF